MSTELLGQHALPWTEEEYFALGETLDRVELFDGSLLVSPNPGSRHQQINRYLINALEAAAYPDYQVVRAVEVRLRRGRIAVPDLIMTSDVDRQRFEAAEVALVGEVVSPERPANDRVLKMHLYAEAGIPWYLLVEPADGPHITLRLYRLSDDRYVEHARASDDEVLRITEPVAVDVTPASLLPRRP